MHGSSARCTQVLHIERPSSPGRLGSSGGSDPHKVSDEQLFGSFLRSDRRRVEERSAPLTPTTAKCDAGRGRREMRPLSSSGAFGPYPARCARLRGARGPSPSSCTGDGGGKDTFLDCRLALPVRRHVGRRRDSRTCGRTRGAIAAYRVVFDFSWARNYRVARSPTRAAEEARAGPAEPPRAALWKRTGLVRRPEGRPGTQWSRSRRKSSGSFAFARAVPPVVLLPQGHSRAPPVELPRSQDILEALFQTEVYAASRRP